MRLWRASLSIRITGDGYDYTTHPATFYVHAVTASDASVAAIRLLASAASPRDEYRTSGSVTEVDSNLDPIVPLRSRSWDDGTHATVQS